MYINYLLGENGGEEKLSTKLPKTLNHFCKGQILKYCRLNHGCENAYSVVARLSLCGI